MSVSLILKYCSLLSPWKNTSNGLNRNAQQTDNHSFSKCARLIVLLIIKTRNLFQKMFISCECIMLLWNRHWTTLQTNFGFEVWNILKLSVVLLRHQFHTLRLLPFFLCNCSASMPGQFHAHFAHKRDWSQMISLQCIPQSDSESCRYGPSFNLGICTLYNTRPWLCISCLNWQSEFQAL